MAKRAKTDDHPESAEAPKVGYGHPPVHSRFKPGRSGNPKGRAPGSRSFQADLDAELRELVQMSENGKTVLATKQVLLIKSIITRAIKGDSRAAKLTIDQIAHHGLAQKEADGPAPLSATDEEILQAYVDRRSRDGSPDDD